LPRGSDLLVSGHCPNADCRAPLTSLPVLADARQAATPRTEPRKALILRLSRFPHSAADLVRTDPVAGEFVDIYFGEKATGDFVSEDSYARRLEAGRPLSPLRVSDGG
jgi:hypothetical protein